MNILWVKNDLLHPLNRGGRLRTYGILRFLRSRHTVTYLTREAAPDAERLEAATQYADHVEIVSRRIPTRGTIGFAAGARRNLLSGDPYALARYNSPEWSRAVRRLTASKLYDIVICDFLTLWPSIARARSELPVVLFQHNVATRVWHRYAALKANPVLRGYFQLQANAHAAWAAGGGEGCGSRDCGFARGRIRVP